MTYRTIEDLPDRQRRRTRAEKNAPARRALLPLLAKATVGILVAVGLAAVSSTAAQAATPGNGLPFDCTGSTIYNIADPGAAGGYQAAINAVSTSSIGSSTGTTSFVSSDPGAITGGGLNAFGITAGGTAAYMVEQAPHTLTPTIHSYNPITQQWSTYSGYGTDRSGNGYSDNYIAGAIDPATGIYYYGTSMPGGAADRPAGFKPNVAPYMIIFAFDTKTNTPIAGPGATGPDGYVYPKAIAAVAAAVPQDTNIYGLAAGPGSQAIFDYSSNTQMNGDMTFDSKGNLYLLNNVRIDDKNAGPQTNLGSVGGIAELPASVLSAAVTSGTNVPYNSTHNVLQFGSLTAGENDPPVAGTKLDWGNPAFSGVNFGMNGVAFDNAGKLYLETTSGGTTSISAFDPNTLTQLGLSTNVSVAGQATGVDLAACSIQPTITLSKNVVGRANASDQFTLSLTTPRTDQPTTSVTTDGTATGVQPQMVGPALGVSGSSYTIAETGAGNTDLSQYTSTWRCIDNGTINGVPRGTEIGSGSGTTATFSYPQPVTGEVGPFVECQFTNTPVSKTAPSTPPATTPSAPPGHLPVVAG